MWYDDWRAGLPDGSFSEEQIDRAFDGGCSAESLVRAEQQRQDGLRAQAQYEAERLAEEQAHEEEMERLAEEEYEEKQAVREP